MVVKIGSYSVGTARHIHANHHVRSLSLEADAAETGDYKHFAIYFYEASITGVGYQRQSNGYVVVSLPMRDYENLYQILQSEKPVYASWVADDSNKLIAFGIGSDEEPLGEGPEDRDP